LGTNITVARNFIKACMEDTLLYLTHFGRQDYMCCGNISVDIFVFKYFLIYT